MFSALFKRIKNDIFFRIRLFLCLSLAFNVIYSIFLFIISQVFYSQWFFVISIYYGLLSVVRIFIFKQLQPKKEKLYAFKTLRACGYFLLLINLVVSIMMFILIYRNQFVSHHEITVITLATYTFFTLTVAIINSIKYIKKYNYVYSCVKIISLISASVSIVTLTNTMLATFGKDNTLLRSVVLPILSGAVSVFIIVCAIIMIRKANTNLRKLKDEKK